ncbi:hypothetical protein ACQP04_09295 [Pseudonocardia halophobica]|uniref:hypothetical protein n=1 Tax=Pseudonocardia halophobica TaxID=29401 RepID=UPI003D921F80
MIVTAGGAQVVGGGAAATGVVVRVVQVGLSGRRQTPDEGAVPVAELDVAAQAGVREPGGRVVVEVAAASGQDLGQDGPPRWWQLAVGAGQTREQTGVDEQVDQTRGL